MTQDAAALLQEALKLPVNARAAIAASLLDSLDSDVDEAAEEAWRVEIQRRLAELDNGSVETVSWPEARRRIVGG